MIGSSYQNNLFVVTLRGNIKTLYFKYLSAAFGSALISSIYGIV